MLATRALSRTLRPRTASRTASTFVQPKPLKRVGSLGKLLFVAAFVCTIGSFLYSQVPEPEEPVKSKEKLYQLRYQEEVFSKSPEELWDEVQKATGKGVTVFVVDGDLPTRHLDGVLDGNFIGTVYGARCNPGLVMAQLVPGECSHSSMIISIFKGAEYSLTPDASIVYLLKSTCNDHYNLIYYFMKNHDGPVVVSTSVSYDYNKPVANSPFTDEEIPMVRDRDFAESNFKIKIIKKQRDIPVFCAAGNDGSREPPRMKIPIACPEVIPVGSLADPASNFGEWVQFYTYPLYYLNFYRYNKQVSSEPFSKRNASFVTNRGIASGTSFSAPMVATVAVRLLELYPWLRVPELLETMTRMSKVVEFKNSNGDGFTGCALIHRNLLLKQKKEE